MQYEHRYEEEKKKHSEHCMQSNSESILLKAAIESTKNRHFSASRMDGNQETKKKLACLQRLIQSHIFQVSQREY